MDVQPEIDTSFDGSLVGREGTIDELHDMYRMHIVVKGFSFRKSTSRRGGIQIEPYLRNTLFEVVRHNVLNIEYVM